LKHFFDANNLNQKRILSHALNLRQFISLIRVPSLSATVAPLLVGGAIASRLSSFNPILWADMFAVALLMQIATNVFNEHGDYVNGVDRYVSHGFAGLIVKGEASPREVFIIAVVLEILAGILAIPIVISRGFTVLALGIVAFLVGILYSEGPVPISRTPFGEVIVGLTMGFIEIVATVLVSAGRLVMMAYLLSLPLSLLVASILTAANTRDIDKDRDVGRKTLAVLLGKERAALLFYSMVIFSYIWIPVVSIITGNVKINLTLLTLPIAYRGLIKLKREGFLYGVEISSIIYIMYSIFLAISMLI
jgi:1,4-dihydroxy-2-naphthoate octaprenyltransferase